MVNLSPHTFTLSPKITGEMIFKDTIYSYSSVSYFSPALSLVKSLTYEKIIVLKSGDLKPAPEIALFI